MSRVLLRLSGERERFRPADRAAVSRDALGSGPGVGEEEPEKDLSLSATELERSNRRAGGTPTSLGRIDTASVLNSKACNLCGARTCSLQQRFRLQTVVPLRVRR